MLSLILTLDLVLWLSIPSLLSVYSSCYKSMWLEIFYKVLVSQEILSQLIPDTHTGPKFPQRLRSPWWILFPLLNGRSIHPGCFPDSVVMAAMMVSTRVTGGWSHYAVLCSYSHRLFLENKAPAWTQEWHLIFWNKILVEEMLTQKDGPNIHYSTIFVYPEVYLMVCQLLVHIVSHHITSHHITSHLHITSHHITPHHIFTSHHITSHHITSPLELQCSSAL